MQKFENVKLRSVRNIFAVNQNPSEERRLKEKILFAIENAVKVGIVGSGRRGVHCKKNNYYKILKLNKVDFRHFL